VQRAHVPNPTGVGGFVKGQSGNPNGRRRAITQLTLEARKHAFLALRTIAFICKKGEPQHAVRLHAAIALLDRGYGRPPQSIELSGNVVQQLDLFAGLPAEEQLQVRDALRAIEDRSGESMDVIDGEVEEAPVEVL
jgi:DNA-binding MarR family transcriptional regulator